MECSKCGVSDSLAPLYDTISPRGIVKLCKRCAIVEGLPTLKKVTPEEEAAKFSRDSNSRFSGPGTSSQFLKTQNQEDITLRDLVDQNFRKNFKEDLEFKKRLVDNFNWVMMRARRSRKMTQKQLAEALRVSEVLIKTLEYGLVPEKSQDLIIRIENYLMINLRTENRQRKTFSDINSVRDLPISKVKEMKLEEPEEEPPIFEMDGEEGK